MKENTVMTRRWRSEHESRHSLSGLGGDGPPKAEAPA